jgi:hypothetical protein
LLAAARASKADDELPPRHAEITFVSASDDFQGLQTVLADLLARLEVTVRFTRISTVDTRQILTEHANDPLAVAHAWIDLRETNRVTLFLSGPRQDRMLIRQVPLVAHIDEVAREEIAHIVESTVDALLVGGRIGIATDEAVGPRAPVPFAPRAYAGPRLDLGVGYEAQVWSGASPPLHGPAVFFGFTAGSGIVRGGLLLSGQFRLSDTVSSTLTATATAPASTVSARLDQGAARLLGVVDAALWRRWTLRGGLGGGVDWVRIAPFGTGSTNFQPSAARMTMVPMLRGLLSMRYALTPRSDAFFGLGSDFDLIDSRYFVRRGVEEPVIFHPWRLRPIAMIGIESDILAR